MNKITLIRLLYGLSINKLEARNFINSSRLFDTVQSNDISFMSKMNLCHSIHSFLE